MSQKSGSLYLVATPIGNLADFTHRAVETLQRVDRIACEDTRHSRILLAHYAIDRPLVAYHDHSPASATARLLDWLRSGESIALICDAGTPLISDPGYPLVRAARSEGIAVIPIPGPCALIAALSAAGLPADRFVFEGFLPRQQAARRARLEALQQETRTAILYESRHRIEQTLGELAATLAADRPLIIARELTKQFERFTVTTVGEASHRLADQPEFQRGEFVLVLAGAIPPHPEQATAELHRVLGILLQSCSLRTAVDLATKLTGKPRALAYETALRIQRERAQAVMRSE